MMHIRTAHRLAPLVALALTAAGISNADDQAGPDAHAAHAAMTHDAAGQSTGDASLTIPQAILTNQHGEQLSLVDDVVGQHIVVMDFVYTHCTTVCPVLSAVLMQVQDEVSEMLGEEVVLASLTVDPLRDTPRQLAAYSGKFGAAPAWHWLTSDKSTMDAVLKQLGAYTANFEDHPSMVLVGDGQTGRWSRFVGFPTPDSIVAKIHELKAARMAAHHH